MVKIPRSPEPGEGIVTGDLRLSKRPPGHVAFERTVTGEMGLVQVALGGSQVVLVWGIVARRGHVELDPGEVKLIEVARWEKRPQFVEVGLDEDITLAKQGRGIQVGFDPALEVFSGRQHPCL